MIELKGYCTFHPLKTCLVGDVFPIEKFSHLKDDRILSPLKKVINETKEDFKLHTRMKPPRDENSPPSTHLVRPKKPTTKE